MNVPRRHHLVPKFLLKRFAKGDKIAMTRRDDLKQMKVIVTSPQKAATQTDFYAIEDKYGNKSISVEAYLSNVEGNAATVIRDILLAGGFPPSESDKAALAQFMAFQIARGQNQRAALRQLYEHIHAMAKRGPSVEVVRDYLRSNLGRVPTDDEIEAQQSRNGAHIPDLPSSRQIANQHLSTMFEVAENTAHYIASRCWQLFTFQTPSLLTGDAPVVCTDPFAPVAGVANADTIFFPLDPTHALALWREDRGEGVFPCGKIESQYINMNVAFDSYNWIHFRPGSHPLDGFELPERGPMVQSGAGSGEL